MQASRQTSKQASKQWPLKNSRADSTDSAEQCSTILCWARGEVVMSCSLQNIMVEASLPWSHADALHWLGSVSCKTLGWVSLARQSKILLCHAIPCYAMHG